MKKVELLRTLADKFETKEFLIGDPSWFMHQVNGVSNQELLAFIASALSYGRRDQFMPKIQYILDASQGEMDTWIRNADFCHSFPDDKGCFYRMYNNEMMREFFFMLRTMIMEYGSIGEYVWDHAHDGYAAIQSLTTYFAAHGRVTVIPKDCSSACKRLCMFLRWMVRDHSPVDLGLWTFIDKRTLIIPLDTHVMQEAHNMQLLNTRTVSMHSARCLTKRLQSAFPDDPVRGDYALFGYGINKGDL